MRSIAFALLAGGVSASLVDDFELFKQKFNRQYKDATEELMRFKIFLETNAMVEKLNTLDGATAVHTAMNMFGDMTPEEKQKYKGLKLSLWDEDEHKLNALPDLPTTGLPKTFDWRDSGAVNAVKDQGQCGSCWAFGTVANIEGATKVQAKKALPNLSEQELVDCSRSDMGCNGGLPSRAYNDMIKNGMGLEPESDYTYHSGTDGEAGKCKAEKSKETIFLHSWKSISSNEDQIQAALYKYGPLAIGLNAGDLQTYSSGVLDPWMCDPFAIDHAVTLVGWGPFDEGMWGQNEYWLIRNSWSATWGEKGYFRMRKGKGKCGLNRMVTTAIMSPDVLALPEPERMDI
jgi:cathepsin F